MEHVHGRSSGGRPGGQLAGVVRGVRARWRLKHALHGSTIAVILGFVVLAICAYALKALHYADAAVLTLRVAAVLALLALVYRFVVRAVLARPRDEQVALYVEEHEPSLGGALLTAVEAESGTHAATTRSPALAARLVRSAVDGIKRVGDGRRVDAAGLQRTSATLAAVVAVAVLVALLGPQSLRHGLRLLVVPWQDAQAAGVFAIKVTPGNASVARGGDQLVTATLRDSSPTAWTCWCARRTRPSGSAWRWSSTAADDSGSGSSTWRRRRSIPSRPAACDRPFIASTSPRCRT